MRAAGVSWRVSPGGPSNARAPRASWKGRSSQPISLTARCAGENARDAWRLLRRPHGLRALALGGADAGRRRRRGGRRDGADRRKAVLDSTARVLDLPRAAIDGDVDVRLVAEVALAVL